MRRNGRFAGIFGAITIMVIVMLAWTTLRLGQLVTPRLGVPAHGEGGFQDGGALPHGRPAPHGLSHWSSWCHDDNLLGRLVLGPFEAPRRLGVFVSGYPRSGSNSLEIRNLTTSETRRIDLDQVGERWLPVRVDLPESWRRAPVEITVTDGAAGPGGWLALSQPYTNPWWTEWARGFGTRLAGFIVVALATGLLIAAAAKLLVHRRRVALASPLLLPLASAVVAAIGYVMFGVGVVSMTALHFLAWITIAIAAFLALAPLPRRVAAATALQHSDGNPRGLLLAGRFLIVDTPHRTQAPRFAWLRHDWFWAATVTLICGFFMISLLHFFGEGRNWSELAQTRYLEHDLPSDNTLPHALTERMHNGQPANTKFADWHGSDRPPLQSGWIFATTAVAISLGVDYDLAGQAAGLCFQLLAIPAMWALLRQLGANRTLTTALVFAIIPSGFFFINLTYVWPKLGAAAFGLTAFLLWFGRCDEITAKDRFIAAGCLAGLAWLSHGGVAFSLLALAPWAAARALRVAWVPWAWSAVAFLLFAGSWAAYQKFYDPPGNRLVKWHLAGAIAPDERGTLETLVDAYRARPLAEWAQSRGQNIRSIYWGHWADLLTFDFNNRPSRRSAEFYHTLFTLGWWNLGWLALPFAITRHPDPTTAALAGRAVLWSIATLIVWIALFYFGGHTVIHQGSYVPLLMLFPLLAWALIRIHPALPGAVALAQGVTFLALWAHPLDDMPGATVSPGAAGAALTALILAVAAVLGSHLVEKRSAKDISGL